MQTDDFKAFSQVLAATYDLMGKTPAARVISPGAQALFFNSVKHYTLEQVSAALAAHCQEGTFTPVPADVKTQIEKHQAVLWVCGNEAWAGVPKLESDCGVLNQVTAAALAVVQDMIDDGDMIGARVAFIKAYEARVEKAKVDPDPAQRAPISWVSGGNHPQRDQDAYGERQMVLEHAQAAGLLPAPPRAALPEPVRIATPGAKPDLKALLLSLKPKHMPPPEAIDYE